ncbi:hypothetical protein LCGC14_3079020, partial [marine sediment metagenome]
LCQWSRIGNVVTVAGKVDIDPTSANIQAQLGMTLPIASNFANDFECGGTGNYTAATSRGAGILADATNDRAEFNWFPQVATNQRMMFTFTYQII